MLSSYWHINVKNSKKKRKHHRVMYGWEPPPNDLVKINFDGSVWNTGKGAGGFLIRDSSACVLLAGGCDSDWLLFCATS